MCLIVLHFEIPRGAADAIKARDMDNMCCCCCHAFLTITLYSRHVRGTSISVWIFAFFHVSPNGFGIVIGSLLDDDFVHLSIHSLFLSLRLMRVLKWLYQSHQVASNLGEELDQVNQCLCCTRSPLRDDKVGTRECSVTWSHPDNCVCNRHQHEKKWPSLKISSSKPAFSFIHKGSRGKH